jgi:hypothetical protein
VRARRDAWRTVDARAPSIEGVCSSNFKSVAPGFVRELHIFPQFCDRGHDSSQVLTITWKESDFYIYYSVSEKKRGRDEHKIHAKVILARPSPGYSPELRITIRYRSAALDCSRFWQKRGVGRPWHGRRAAIVFKEGMRR